MQNSWEKLLNKIGIAKTFEDAAQNHKTYNVNDETLRQMVNYLGFELKDINESEQLLRKIENKRWQYVLEPIYVVRSGQKVFDAVVKAEEKDQIKLHLLQGGKSLSVEYMQEVIDTRQIGHGKYAHVQFVITSEMAPQYYEIELSTPTGVSRRVLAVTPDKCYVPEVLQKQKLWGFTVQLYALTSARNW